jgi:hypothetical protein
MNGTTTVHYCLLLLLNHSKEWQLKPCESDAATVPCNKTDGLITTTEKLKAKRVWPVLLNKNVLLTSDVYTCQ